MKRLLLVLASMVAFHAHSQIVQTSAQTDFHDSTHADFPQRWSALFSAIDEDAVNTGFLLDSRSVY